MRNDMFFATTDKGETLFFDVLEHQNTMRLTLKKEMLEGVKQLRALSEFTSASFGDEGYWILPRNIGMSGDIQTFFEEREELTYVYDRPIMSCFGVKRQDRAYLVRVERNYHYSLEAEIKNGKYALSVLYDFTNHDKPYDDIRIEIVALAPDADFNDMAREERNIRLSREEIVPLSQKCAREAVEYARKYPLIRIRMGWKPSPTSVYIQTQATEPEMHVACDFAQVRKLADELKAQGVEGAELQLVGWNIGGHDGRFPQLFPADPRLGGDEGLKKTVAHVKALGYRISLHTNSIDAYPIADTFTWDDIVINQDGTHKRAGCYGGGYAFHVCPIKQLKNIVRDLPAVKALETNGLHFTDVNSIVLPDTCYAEDHPCDLTCGIIYFQKMMDYTRGMFGGFSSEGCFDFANKHLDFGLYVSFGDGFGKKIIPIADRLIPFFELIYHGTVLYNPTSPTVNYLIKSPAERLTLYMRGGRPALYFYSKFRTGGATNWMGEIDLVCDTDEQLKENVAKIKQASDEYLLYADLQLSYIKSYEISDNVEIVTYENGARMVGNYNQFDVEFEGKLIPAMDFKLFN